MAVLQMVKAAFIKAHSDPGLDKSSIHFTRPKSPREDRNPLIWKRGQQKVSRLCAAGAPSSGAANSATTPDRAASTARGGGFWNPIRGSGRSVAGFPGYNPSD
jgi:hypothetical protein